MVMAKENFDYDFSLWCNLCLKSKAEIRSESAVLFLYIFSIFVAATHLATKLYKKMEKIYKNVAGLSLVNSAFAVTDPKTIW